MIYAIIDRNRILGWFETFINFIRDYPYIGPLMIIVAYIFATILFLPGLVLTLGSGFALNQAYGNIFIALPIASLSVFLGAEIGATCAFLLGRYIVRKPVQNKIMKYKYFNAIDTAISK